MRLFITTGHVLSNVGGPAQYGPKLKEEFENAGHKVRLISYDAVERILPIGLRHIYFFLKILPSIVWADKVITLDTFSVGVPSVFAAKLSGREIAVRIGGDFLWESYVERTGNKITLKQFNEHIPQLNIKERLIFYFTKILINLADRLAFNTEWQKEIWREKHKKLRFQCCVPNKSNINYHLI